MNIARILRMHAETRSDATAMIDTHSGRRRTFTFAELELASARAATMLAQAGLQPGDAVLIFQPMSAELYIALSAIFRLGLVAMFIDPGQGKAHLEQSCTLHRPQALIGNAKAHLLRLISPQLRSIPRKFVIGTRLPGAIPWRHAANLQPYHEIHHCAPDNPALLTFTSGSTGRPKAALRTHGFLLAQHEALVDSLRLRAGVVDLTTMPIVALANLASGVTSLIPGADLRRPATVKPAPIVAQIQAERVSSTVASPALLERLARYCLANHITLTGLRRVSTGGAPVFPRLLHQLQQIAPGADVEAVYGSTEAEPMAKITYGQILDGDRQRMREGGGLLTGRPVDSLQLRIMKNQWGTPAGPFTEIEFASRCCATEQAGEIVVSGAHVLSGYWHGHGDQETKFRVNGTIWHRTGDTGHLDARGRLWLLGRCTARIDDEFGTLHPFAAECAASYHPNIRRVAVASEADRRILAVDLYDPKAKPDLASLKESLAWAHLDEIRVFKHLPVDQRHNAKIDYPALRKMLA
jgi:acyl-CoA synthetase (AMP-forming)/AMP-acid ligase II